ncbi:hypothetical protein LINGRAPRIM_LOCUS591 [Linum grandiflorum]
MNEEKAAKGWLACRKKSIQLYTTGVGWFFHQRGLNMSVERGGVDPVNRCKMMKLGTLEFEYERIERIVLLIQKFIKAMEDLGLANRRRRVIVRNRVDDEEVEFVNEISVNQAGGTSVVEPPPKPEVCINDAGPDDQNADPAYLANDEMNLSGSESEEYDPDFQPPTNQSPESSYRGSSQSAHESDDKIDGEEVQTYPDLDTTKLAQEIKETHGIEVSARVCSNAKQEAKRMIEGTLRQAYGKLRSYLLQLKTSNLEGKFVLERFSLDSAA